MRGQMYQCADGEDGKMMVIIETIICDLTELHMKDQGSYQDMQE